MLRSIVVGLTFAGVAASAHAASTPATATPTSVSEADPIVLSPFSVTSAGTAWDIGRKLANGSEALVGAGLFAGASATTALAKARALVKAIYPVGIRVVGPNVAHPSMIGDLKIVGPNVMHPNFIYWDKDSTSFAK